MELKKKVLVIKKIYIRLNASKLTSAFSLLQINLKVMNPLACGGQAEIPLNI